MQPDTVFDTIFDSEIASDQQRQAFARFKSSGLPHRRMEAWKYSDFRDLAKRDLNFDGEGDEANDDLPFTPRPIFEESYQIVLTADQLRIDEALEPYIRFEASEGSVIGKTDNPMANLNQAFCDDVIILDLPDNTALDKPVELFIYTSENAFAVQQLYISLGEKAGLRLIEHVRSGTNSFYNQAMRIELSKDAHLDHTVLQQSDEGATYYNYVHLSGKNQTGYQGFVLNKGAAKARFEMLSDVDGEQSELSISGVNLIDGDRLNDITLETRHNEPNARSRQHFKTVLNDQATGVFQGKIYVDRKAQKTDGYQMNNALLLSPHCQMNSKPQLEIYADDVKCSHGATTGQLDKNALFYLRSRGLSKEQATELLIHAFVAEAVRDIGHEDIETHIMEGVKQWLLTRA